MRFLDDEGVFDVEAYRHAIDVFTTAMEIVVDLASYPTREIAQNSHDFRPLGLGFANLGAMLMVKGIPYDSDEGRNVAASLSAILCGRAYATSAAIAARKGPFQGYFRNRDSMLEVMNMHRQAAYGIGEPGVPDALHQAARADWDQVLELGERHGFRNAQATVIAPTGTIGLLMDCDTTGVEPDFALVKFKKLAGGGYFKIINQSVPASLRALGYTESQIGDILNYVVGTQSLGSAPCINREKLLDRGLSAESVQRVEETLPGVFELRQAFAPALLAKRDLERLAIDETASGGDVLLALGYTDREIDADELEICGRMTIEGAPHLRSEHLPVFDCANRCGKLGERFIHHMGHIRMMAAVQPFISGAISKTINMPNEATVEEIKEAYFTAWKSGLKAVALYRDGCKHSQPLAAVGEQEQATRDGSAVDDGADTSATHTGSDAAKGTAGGNGKPVAQTPTETKSVAGAAADGMIPAAGPGAAAPPPGSDGMLRRTRLPAKRTGFTQEARVGNNKVYLRTGEYPDGRLGEIFLDMHKEGAAFRSIMNCFAIAVSLGLQHGVPLEEYVDAFVFTRFDPQGPCDHPNIKFATSVIDYIFRVLGMEYLDRTDFVQVKPADQDEGEEQVIETIAQVAQAAPPAVVAAASTPETTPEDAMSRQARQFMGDAPFCDCCGHLTVRNGSCYKCLNCGNSMGCS
jgi:ribonucleoside-diphosphate reductase alpha chain